MLVLNGRLRLDSEIKVKVPSEDWEQMHLVSWMRKTYPAHKIFAIPNGGYRSKTTAMNLKSTGVSPGVPDLFIPSLKLFIEMKRTKGSVTSQEQKDWIAYLNEVGYTAIICKGFESAKIEIIKIINGL